GWFVFLWSRVGGGGNVVRRGAAEGHPAANRGCRAGGKVLFVRHPGLSKMHVPVDNARKYVFTLSVDFLAPLRQTGIGSHRDELSVLDRHPPLKGFFGRHHPSIFDN